MMTEYGGGDNNHRVSDWEIGLPSSDDLTPLSHRLISPELASAFSISPETHRTFSDVGYASENTFSCLRGNKVSGTETEEEPERGMNGDDVARGTKRARRLVWTPQLHKRFVEVVSHLGVKNAVPKTIMQMMNVEGLTRENVASHLQKYRLYLKRMQGLSEEGPSSSDHLFASSPIPQDPESGNAIMHHVPVPLMPGHGPYQWMQPQMEGSGNYKFGFVG